MRFSRRDLLKTTAAGTAALALPGSVFAAGKELYVAGATYNLRDPILQEFTKRTGIEVKPWINPSSQARVDRVRMAPLDTVETGVDFMNYAWEEKLIVPIDIARLPNWNKLHPLIRDGRAGPDSPLGLGDNPGTAMYVDAARTKTKYVPYMYQLDSIGYNPEKVPADDNSLSWGELFNPKWRGKASLYGIDWLGTLDAAMAMQSMGLLNAKDVTNLTEKELDTLHLFLREKKKEGHFRALWKTFGELVNLMTSGEVWIADAWWPTVVEVRKKGVPCRYAVAKEGYRAWAVGSTITSTCKNLDGAYEWLNFWLEGYAGAQQSEIGFFSPVDTYEKYLTPEQVKQWYGGEGREGGSIQERTRKVWTWNTRPKNLELYTEKWNEFLAG